MTFFTKRSLIATWAFILAIVVIIFWYRWDSGTNHSLKFGYYGEFNTVSNTLARLPGVHIVNSGYNADVSLEEFGFEIEARGRPLKLFFSEKNPIRGMSGAELEEALSDFVEKELMEAAQ
jgi:hypothetical protein